MDNRIPIMMAATLVIVAACQGAAGSVVNMLVAAVPR